ncbi:hypothetical protein EDC01DRAFT_655869 [Geopyxis carbonaria]|nr:hypothetical protein EDC01DRAFT_655869 [Geopyxis carbonaria]
MPLWDVLQYGPLHQQPPDNSGTPVAALPRYCAYITCSARKSSRQPQRAPYIAASASIHTLSCNSSCHPSTMPYYSVLNVRYDNYCKPCLRTFKSAAGLQMHLDTSGAHATEFRCLLCPGDGRTFVNELALWQHLRDKVHPEPRPEELRCEPCDRTFGSRQALAQHKASLVHKPISETTCPFAGCGRKFAAPSAWTLHMESGACVSGLKRRDIDRAMFEHDTAGMVCHGLAADSVLAVDVPAPAPASDDGDSSGGGGALTPASTSSGGGALTPTSTITSTSGLATPQSGTSTALVLAAFTCPKCPAWRAPFTSAATLQRHLDSPAHAPKIYHCPTALLPSGARGRRKTFATLSGLAQHLETGVCAGGGDAGRLLFTKAMEMVSERFRALGLGEVRLVG